MTIRLVFTSFQVFSCNSQFGWQHMMTRWSRKRQISGLHFLFRENHTSFLQRLDLYFSAHQDLSAAVGSSSMYIKQQIFQRYHEMF